ncbi:MAG: hypothetical protein IJ555_14130 [Ruminococcus sp.]|nr:hypothetical protein [Ruminococcus sp.]
MAAEALAVFTVIAGLTAFFTSVDSVTNSFRAATLAIRVVEPNWIPNPTVVPEQHIAKDPYIDNVDETPAYVFMEVIVPAEEIILEHNAPDEDKGKPDSIISVPLFRFVNNTPAYTQDQKSTEQMVNSNWYLLDTAAHQDSAGNLTDITYLYAYVLDNTSQEMKVLHPGERTDTPLFNEVIFCNAREDDELSGSKQSIKIKVYGIQTEFLKSSEQSESEAEKVWQILSKQR